jgi:hypothetical protein
MDRVRLTILLVILLLVLSLTRGQIIASIVPSDSCRRPSTSQAEQEMMLQDPGSRTGYPQTGSPVQVTTCPNPRS